MRTKYAAAAGVMLILLAGCATNQPKFNIYDDRPASPRFDLPASEINVIDQSVPTSAMQFTLGLGFSRIAGSNYDPTPGEMLRRYSLSFIKAVGGSQHVDVRFTDVGLFVKMQVEDRMPLVNLFAFGKTPRPYMCTANVTITVDGHDHLKELSSYTTVIDPANVDAFIRVVSKCQVDLVAQIADEIRRALPPS